MEEKENNGLTKQKPSQSESYKKISDIEKSVQNMKLHLNFLSKQEQVQDKKINLLYNNSLQIANNKVNHVSSHVFQKSLQGSKHSEYQKKKSMVRQMREKEIQELRETRIQVSQLREKQTKQLRQFSRNNSKVIRTLREQEKIQNIKKADRVRLQEKQKKQRQTLQKQRKKKQLQQLQAKNLQEENIKKSYLKAYIAHLRSQEQEIEERIKQKRQTQQRMKETIKAIPTVKDEEVVTIAKAHKKKSLVQNKMQQTGQKKQLNKQQLIEKILGQKMIRLR